MYKYDNQFIYSSKLYPNMYKLWRQDFKFRVQHTWWNTSNSIASYSMKLWNRIGSIVFELSKILPHRRYGRTLGCASRLIRIKIFASQDFLWNGLNKHKKIWYLAVSRLMNPDTQTKLEFISLRKKISTESCDLASQVLKHVLSYKSPKIQQNTGVFVKNLEIF